MSSVGNVSDGQVVRCVIDNVNTSGTITSTRIVNLIASDVIQNGERAVDTGSFTVPIDAIVNQNDIVKYIQDVADVTYLFGIWNFQDSLFDEAGFNLDGTRVNSALYAYDINNFRMINFSGVSNDKVTINDNAVMIFSGMFEFHVFLKSAFQAGSGTIISKANSTTGFELGVTGTATSYITLNTWVGGVNTALTGSHINLNDNGYHYIQMLRDANNVISVYVDNTLEIQSTISGDLTNRTVSLIFGSNNAVSAGTKNLVGYIQQVRMYCGANLNTTDATNVRIARRQPDTMKHAGLVWNIRDDVTTKTLSTKGWGNLLNTISINPTIASPTFVGRTALYVINGGSTSICQVYLTNGGYLSANAADPDGIAAGYSLPLYMLNGTLMNNLITLSVMMNGFYHITPRQLIVLENRDQDHTSTTKFDYKKHQIINLGQDNSALVNDLQTVITQNNIWKQETFSGTGASQTLSLGHQVSNTLQLTVGGVLKLQGTDYTVTYADASNSNLTTITGTFTSGTNNVAVSYNYIDTANLTWRIQDTSSISQFGRFSKLITLPSLVAVQQPAKDFTSNFIAKYKNMNERIQIVSPTLMNNIRPNYKVVVNNPLIDVNNANYTIRTIEYKYPQAQTIITVGEYLFDVFDLQNQSTTTVSYLNSAQVGNKTV